MKTCLARFGLGLLIISATMAAEPLDKVVAVVNDKVITATELNAQADRIKKQLTVSGTPIPPDTLLRKQVLQTMIDADLQLEIAAEHQLKVEEAEVQAVIRRIAAANKLSPTAFQQVLATQGIDFETYKANLRKEILIARVQQKALAKEIVVTPKQVEDYLKTAPDPVQQDRRYHVQNIIIPLPEAPTSDKLVLAEKKAAEILAKARTGADFERLRITESDNENLLEGGDLGEQHLAELPDLFAKAVRQMHPGQVAGPLRAGNGLHLLKLVAIEGDSEKHAVVKYHVRHILIKPGAGLTTEQAKKQAFNVYQQLKSSRNFPEMAKRYSADMKSAIKGGELGWIGSGEVVPPFEKAMMSLPLRVISKPVKSVFGWHIIEVLEKKTVDDTVAFKQQQIRRFLQQKKFAEAVQDWQQNLRVTAYVKILDKDLA